jgi:hypothetical protein
MTGLSENFNINEEKIDIKSVKTPEELQQITKEIEVEIKTEEKATENTNVTDADASKKYVKISPTFHVMFLSGETEHEIYRIFNPQTNTIEERELNDLEKHEIQVKEFKESKIRFRNVKHDGNITTVKFGADYHKKRQRKNRIQKASRKLTRKK